MCVDYSIHGIGTSTSSLQPPSNTRIYRAGRPNAVAAFCSSVSFMTLGAVSCRWSRSNCFKIIGCQLHWSTLPLPCSASLVLYVVVTLVLLESSDLSSEMADHPLLARTGALPFRTVTFLNTWPNIPCHGLSRLSKRFSNRSSAAAPQLSNAAFLLMV